MKVTKRRIVYTILAIALVLAVSDANAIIIDTFDDEQSAFDVAGGGNTLTTVLDSFNSIDDMIGTDRDFFVEALGSGFATLTASTGDLSWGNTATSNNYVKWDAFSNQDLTVGGGDGIYALVNNTGSAATTMTFEVFDGTNTATLSKTILGGTTAFITQNWSFAGFTPVGASGPVDFTSVDSIQLTFSGLGANANMQILQTTNPVPEPATMLLFGTGLIGVATIGRKKLRQR